MPVVIDAPGKLVSPLLSELGSLGVEIADITLDDGDLCRPT
jgi:hypothetical protein